MALDSLATLVDGARASAWPSDLFSTLKIEMDTHRRWFAIGFFVLGPCFVCIWSDIIELADNNASASCKYSHDQSLSIIWKNRLIKNPQLSGYCSFLVGKVNQELILIGLGFKLFPSSPIKCVGWYHTTLKVTQPFPFSFSPRIFSLVLCSTNQPSDCSTLCILRQLQASFNAKDTFLTSDYDRLRSESTRWCELSDDAPLGSDLGKFSFYRTFHIRVAQQSGLIVIHFQITQPESVSGAIHGCAFTAVSLERFNSSLTPVLCGRSSVRLSFNLVSSHDQRKRVYPACPPLLTACLDRRTSATGKPMAEAQFSKYKVGYRRKYSHRKN